MNPNIFAGFLFSWAKTRENAHPRTFTKLKNYTMLLSLMDARLTLLICMSVYMPPGGEIYRLFRKTDTFSTTFS